MEEVFRILFCFDASTSPKMSAEEHKHLPSHKNVGAIEHWIRYSIMLDNVIKRLTAVS